MSKTDPIKSTKDIKRLKDYFLQEGKYRDYAMVTLVLNTSIKIDTMLKLRWKDIIELGSNRVKEELVVDDIAEPRNKGDKQESGKRPEKIYFNNEVRKAFEIYRDSLEQICSGEYVFKSRVGENKPLGRIAVHKMVKKAAAELGIEGNISIQSLKKTLGYQAWEQGYSREVIMDLYHHPNFNYTRKFLSIDDGEEEEAGKRKLMEEVRL